MNSFYSLFYRICIFIAKTKLKNTSSNVKGLIGIVGLLYQIYISPINETADLIGPVKII